MYGKNECLNCGKALIGRTDKKYCNSYCKSSFHYKKSNDETPSFYNKVNNQLRKNRQILKSYNKAGKSTLRTDTLYKEGFDPNFFTHYWKNSKGEVYLFVYEYGFLKISEKNIEKYVLVIWQDYMSKQK